MSPTESTELEREEREIERLLRAAGPRPALATAELEAARAAAARAFRAQAPAPAPLATPSSRRLRRPGTRWMLAAAAALVAVAGTLTYRAALAPRPSPPPTPPVAVVVAQVEIASGAATVRRGGEEPGGERPLTAGERLPAGAALAIDSGARLTLRLAGGASLRVDGGSALTLVSNDEIELARGRIYLDHDPAALSRAPVIATRVGHFVEVGTQFELSLDAGEGGALLRVREGRVELRNGRLLEASAGQALAVARDGSSSSSAIDVYGPEWAWVLDAAPRPSIDGWTLGRFLAWLGRESGLRVELADRAAAERAAAVTVHGSVEHLSPFAAAEVVLASAGCSYTVEGDRLVVRSAD